MFLGLLPGTRVAGTQRACGPCRRARRRGRPGHRCYGAVTGPDRFDEITWVVCPCGCLVVGDGLDQASPDDDTVHRVVAAGAAARDSFVRPRGDEDVDQSRRHFSTG